MSRFRNKDEVVSRNCAFYWRYKTDKLLSCSSWAIVINHTQSLQSLISAVTVINIALIIIMIINRIVICFVDISITV